MTGSPAITDLERAAAAHWQAAEQEWLGSWLLRADSGFTGRANSVLPLGDPGLPLAPAVDRAEAWYAARGLPATVAVPGPAAGAAGVAGVGRAATGAPDPLDELLAARGWRIRSGAAVVMTAPSAAVAAVPAPAVPVTFADRPDEGWLGRYHYRGRELPAGAFRLLLSAPWQAFASVRIGGRIAAVGRVSVAAGWGGLTAIDVAPQRRRTGLGTVVTTALVAEAARRGAQQVFLQVEEDNTAARALYARCGFRVAHRYHYRVAG